MYPSEAQSGSMQLSKSAHGNIVRAIYYGSRPIYYQNLPEILENRLLDIAIQSVIPDVNADAAKPD